MRELILALLLALPAAAADKAPAADVDILRLDVDMARFLVKHVKAKLDPETRLLALTDAVFSRKGLGIDYEDTGTRTAIETFRSRSGNCLSFTILFVAMARHLGLAAYFVEVDEVMSWDRRGDFVVRNHHMYVEVEVENGRMEVDFLPGKEKRYHGAHRVDDRRVLAHYYSNLGVEKLASGHPKPALESFERAIAADPEFAYAWTNLGVAARTLGDFVRAEQSHLKALEIDPGEPAAATNLASLYMATGRQAEAEPLLRKVDADLRRNPYHHFRLGAKALHDGDPAAAIRHYREAIRRRPEESEFHAALAAAYRHVGEIEKARASFEKALALARDDEQKERLRRDLAALGPPP